MFFLERKVFFFWSGGLWRVGVWGQGGVRRWAGMVWRARCVAGLQTPQHPMAYVFAKEKKKNWNKKKEKIKKKKKDKRKKERRIERGTS